MIHSNAPWVPSGYGKQTAHLARALRSLGHEVVISSFCGLTGAPMEWEGFTVLPSGMYEFGVDVLLPHIEHVQPDLTITLMDAWKLGPLADALMAHRIAAWLPIDCTPLSKLDEAFLRKSGVKPIAMSRFGQDRLVQAGFEPLYAPHVVDREVFKPLTDDQRAEYRRQMGLDGKFVIGLCAANNDAARKGFPEQFAAFAGFHKKHPEAMLLVHSIPQSPRGLDLARLAGEMGIAPEVIRVSDTYGQVSGLFDDTLLADWYATLDLLTMCSYAEAFGVPLIEAQACGTPVVVTQAAAMDELSDQGWRVQGNQFWNHVHGAWWTRPRIDAITRAYGKALAAPDRRESAAKFAAQYDARDAAEIHWKPLLETLCG